MANSLQVRTELNKVYDQLEILYTPAVFRSIVPIAYDVEPWVHQIDVDTVQDFAEMRLVSQFQTELPAGAEEKTTVGYPVYAWGLSFNYQDREVDRSVQLGVTLPTRRAAANTMRVEQFLDKVSALGGVQEEGGTPIGGLLRQAAVTPTSITGTWSGATAEVIAEDIIKVWQAVRTTSKGLFSANKIVMPESRMQLAQRKRSTVNPALTAMDLAMQTLRAWQQDLTFHTWQHAELAGGAFNTTRMCAFQSRPDVAKHVIPLELTSYDAEKRGFNWIVPQQVVSAGVISEFPEGIAYGDGL